MKKPVNEMGVVSLFSQYAQGLGYVIMEIQIPFPDATLYEIAIGKLIRAEFEYKAKNFLRHGHDASQFDLIICWQNDWQESPLEVLSLDAIHGKEPIETVYDLEQRTKRIEGKLADAHDKISFQRRNVIDLFNGETKTGKFRGAEFEVHSILYCKYCGNALREIYAADDEMFLLEENGDIKIRVADVSCKCNAIRVFRSRLPKRH